MANVAWMGIEEPCSWHSMPSPSLTSDWISPVELIVNIRPQTPFETKIVYL